jgi:hypothetical protein
MLGSKLLGALAVAATLGWSLTATADPAALPRLTEPPAAPVREPRSEALMYGGVATGMTGLALALGGVGVRRTVPSCASSLDCLSDQTSVRVSNVGSTGLMIAGGALLAGSATMITVGAWPVRKRSGAVEASFGISPRSATLRFVF